MELFKQVGICQHILHISGFVVALTVLSRNENIPKYMKTFFYYPLGAFTMSLLYIFSEHIKLIPLSLYSTINNLSVIFHFAFLGKYIISFCTTEKNKKISTIVFFVILVSVIACLSMKQINVGNKLALGIANSGLVILCLLYYQSLLKDESGSALTKEPFFWIVNGIFLGMVVNVPAYLTRDFLSKEASYELWSLLYIFCVAAYVIMHSFFIKAYLCTIRPNKFL